MMPQVRFRTKLWLVGALRHDPTLVTPSERAGERVAKPFRTPDRQRGSVAFGIASNAQLAGVGIGLGGWRSARCGGGGMVGVCRSLRRKGVSDGQPV
jgi:hypothetical protein